MDEAIEDNSTEMPPKAKAKPPMKKAPNASSSLADVTGGLANLTVTSAVAKIEMPMLMYEWWRAGVKRLSIDMLVFSGLQNQHVSVIAKGEKCLTVKFLIPVYPLFHPGRLALYKDEFNNSSARYAAMEGASDSKLKSSSRPDEGFIDYEVKVDLPFPIEENFHYQLEQYFPYSMDDPRFDDEAQAREGLNHMVSVLLVEMVAKEKKTNVKPPTPNQVQRRGIPVILADVVDDDDGEMLDGDNL